MFVSSRLARCFGPLGKFQHNIKISIKTARVSRLYVLMTMVSLTRSLILTFLNPLLENDNYHIPHRKSLQLTPFLMLKRMEEISSKDVLIVEHCDVQLNDVI